jgi:hypothetical protein
MILFLPLELLLGPDHDLKNAPQYFISRPLSLIIFNYQKCILLFFLRHARPDSVDRAVGLGHFEFKQEPLPAEELLRKRELLFWRVANSMNVGKQGAFQGPPRPS